MLTLDPQRLTGRHTCKQLFRYASLSCRTPTKCDFKQAVALFVDAVAKPNQAFFAYALHQPAPSTSLPAKIAHFPEPLAGP